MAPSITRLLVFLVVLWFCVAVCLSQTTFFSHSFKIDAKEEGQYFNLGNMEFENTFQTNLNISTFLTGNCNITLCMSLFLAPYPDIELWSKTCSFINNFSETNVFLINPRMGLYQLHGYSQTASCTAAIVATGIQCAEGTYGKNCETPTSLPHSEKLTLSAGSQMSFSFAISKLWNNHLKFILDCTDTCTIEMYSREGNVPYIDETIYDRFNSTIETSTTISYVNPAVDTQDEGRFIYFITVINKDSSDAQIMLTPVLNLCEDYYAGPNCELLVPIFHIGYTYILSNPNGTEYGLLFMSEASNFAFSFQIISAVQTLEEVAIYWRLNAIPTTTEYDLMLSSTFGVTLPNPVYYNSGTPDEMFWYFMIVDPLKRDFSLWFTTSTCPYNCDGIGVCNANHTCTCNNDDRNHFGCRSLNSVDSDYYYAQDDIDDNSDGTSLTYYIILMQSILFFVVIVVILIGVAVCKSKFSPS